MRRNDTNTLFGLCLNYLAVELYIDFELEVKDFNLPPVVEDQLKEATHNVSYRRLNKEQQQRYWSNFFEWRRRHRLELKQKKSEESTTSTESAPPVSETTDGAKLT